MSVAFGWVLLAGLVAFADPAASPPTSTIWKQAWKHAAGGPSVSVWTDRDDPYRRGERARIFVSAEEPAYVTVLRVDTDGRLRVVFPRDPWGNSYVRPGRTVELAGERRSAGFLVDDDPGLGYLFAISSPEPFDYSELTQGDYWDYRALDEDRVEGDPYVALTDLAERITADGEYDYDVASYAVGQPYEYPRFVCYNCHIAASYAEWDPYRTSCRRYRLEIYNDPAYYPFRYNRGRGVVADRPTHPAPRFVFRDADPSRTYVTRREGQSETGHDGRTETRRDRSPVRDLVEQRRRAHLESSGEVRDRAPATVRPESLSASPRRSVVPRRLVPLRDRPRSTGEPELRRRRRGTG